MSTESNSLITYYKPSEIISIFRNLLSMQNLNAKIVSLNGVYIKSQSTQLYNNCAYDTLRDENTDEEVSLLEKACRYHTTRHRTGNPTIDVCFDADRLDLGRVGIVPNPKLMATEQGAYYAKNILWIDNLNSNKSL